MPGYNSFDLGTRHIPPQFFHNVVKHKSTIGSPAKQKVSRKEAQDHTTYAVDDLNVELSPVRRRIIFGSNYIP